MAYVAPQTTSNLDRYYTNPSHLRGNTDPYPKSHAQPPPPLRSAAARVRQQTLGPVFSDEEDGDDSEYIAMRMQEMQMGQGYDQSVTAAHMHQLQLQQQALAIQQQYLLQQLLSSQQQQPRQPATREAAIRQQQLHQMQQLQLQAQMRQHQQVDPRIQAQLLSQLQASVRGPAQQAELRSQAMAAQAQLQAQVQARAQVKAENELRARFENQPLIQARAQAIERAQAGNESRARFEAQPRAPTIAQAQAENEAKARFESQPNTRKPPTASPEKSPVQSTPDSPTESPSKPPLGRFAQARQTASNPFGELTALLARRSAEKPPPIADAPQVPQASEDRLAARQGLQSIGLGRPAASAAQNRAKSNPFPVSPNNITVDLPAVRAVSLAPPMKPIRQPFGPPAPTNELGDRNFQAMVRKKAGKGLGMLGRRGEGSGGNSPVVA